MIETFLHWLLPATPYFVLGLTLFAFFGGLLIGRESLKEQRSLLENSKLNNTSSDFEDEFYTADGEHRLPFDGK